VRERDLTSVVRLFFYITWGTISNG